MKALIESEALKARPSKKFLAKHSKSAAFLKELSNDPKDYVRSGVALNRNCPVEILKKLSNDSDWLVRYYVAGNYNCSVEILEKLSNDSTHIVKENANQSLNRIRSAKG